MQRSQPVHLLGLALLLAPLAGAQTNTLVSLSSAGDQTNGQSMGSLISANGRFAVFHSAADNLVAGDNDLRYDVFRRDLVTGTTELVSVGIAGGSADGLGAYAQGISEDGRFIVWSTDATDLVPGDTNDSYDVFFRDMTNQVTTRISVDQAGNQVPQASYVVSMSLDAEHIAFDSSGALLTGDTNGASDCYHLDRMSGVLTLISASQAGVQGDGNSYSPSMSYDGRYVVFASDAGNLVAGDTNGVADIFRKDLQTGAIERVSVSSQGIQASADSSEPRISGDGQTVAYCSQAGNLVPSDSNNTWDLFAWDVSLGQTERLNVTPSGSQSGTGLLARVALSGDGRYVAFNSQAADLVPGDTNGFVDIFLRDRLLNVTSRVNVSYDDGQVAGHCFRPHMTPDAQTVTYDSNASNVVMDDTNGFLDIFASVLTVDIGTSYCGPAVPNSTGAAGVLSVKGNTYTASNNVILTAANLPMNQVGYFLNSLAQGFVQNPGSSQGNLCLAGSIGRYNPNEGYVLQNSGTFGSISLAIDLNSTPTPAGPVSILAGETWNFQCWHRDQNPSASTNFTQAVSIAFQ